MKHVVPGAGPLGTSLARMLTSQDSEVALFGVMGNPAYDMPGTVPPAIDGTDPGQLRRACDGAGAVYLCLNAHYVDWYDLFPCRLEASIAVAAEVGAKLVYHDNVYMYGAVGEPLSEGMAYAAKTRKGRLRAEMATTVLQAARSGRIRGVSVAQPTCTVPAPSIRR